MLKHFYFVKLSPPIIRRPRLQPTQPCRKFASAVYHKLISIEQYYHSITVKFIITRYLS